MKILDEIKVFDNVLNDQQFSIAHNYLSSSFKWGKSYSDPDVKNKFIWQLPFLEKEKFVNQELLSKIEDLTNMKFNLNRAYGNAQTYGMEGHFHYDIPEENGYTFLIYMNEVWNVEWGGETIFLDKYYDCTEKCDIELSKNFKSFLPKPNSALFFPGKIYHFGKSPSRDFQDIRYTLAFKLLKK